MPPHRLGDIPSTLRTPDLYVLVSAAGVPRMRIDLYRGRGEYHCFQEAVIWKEFVVIGFAERLHLVDLQSGHRFEFKLESCFGSLWLGEMLLLAASAQRIFCIGSDATLRWRSRQLAIDGIVMQDPTDRVLRGSGEWDPPGGWRDFCLSLEDGTLLPAT